MKIGPTLNGEEFVKAIWALLGSLEEPKVIGYDVRAYSELRYSSENISLLFSDGTKVDVRFEHPLEEL